MDESRERKIEAIGIEWMRRALAAEDRVATLEGVALSAISDPSEDTDWECVKSSHLDQLRALLDVQGPTDG